MKKILAITLAAVMVISMAACGSTPAAGSAPAAADKKELTGVGEGFGGLIKVAVTVEADKITSVTITEHSETAGISDTAINGIPEAIVKTGKADVDTISGATTSSKGIIYAVKNAIDPAAFPAPTPKADETEKKNEAVKAAKATLGTGTNFSHRIGPGKDDTETPVYSFNQVFVNAIFDDAGKIMHLNIDQLEVATPNYDGDGMPHFSGFPGQGGYNYDDNHDGKVDGKKTAGTEDAFSAEIASWNTKRERGDSYKMGTGTWSQQMNSFEKKFIGMTVEEVEAWFAKYCSDLNGRPLKITDKSEDEDKAKFDKLTDAEKADLAELTSSATMSLNDSHGNILAALKDAYAKRVPLEVTAAAQGFGLVSTPRMGPGKDDTETPVYSFNQVFANTLFDKDGKIAAIYIDQLEVATPNYDGDGMPHFSGFPGQGGYNYDDNHDGKIDGKKTADTEDAFAAEIASWATKRARGDSYKMGTGTWSQQMDTFQKLFVGKTPEEVKAWSAKYCSDLNGRPLKITDKSKDEDKAKFDKLTDAEKADLAELTSSATMSLNDSHGDIIAAIVKSLDNKVAVDVTIG